jgi:hypothetical protein
MAWLTKSRFMSGQQCAKRLWLDVHDPVHEPLTDAMPFVNGRAVDAAVQAAHPGVVISRERGMPAAIAETARIIQAGAPAYLYQPAFRQGDCAVIADVLRKVESRFELVEVKASTSLKPEHVPDAAYQTLVLRSAKIPVSRVFIARVNNQFVLQREGDYAGLIVEENITDTVDAMQSDIADSVAALQEVMASPDVPAIAMGSHCHAPYDCPFIERCTRERGPLPAFPVTLLPRGDQIAAALAAEGYQDLCDVPVGRLTSDLHVRVHAATVSGTAFFDASACEALRELGHPRAYLDFETIALAVPQVIGTRPYEQLPFQWSLHVEEAGGEVRHAEYLAIESFGDFERLGEALLDATPRTGPVLAYNASFERRVLEGLAMRVPRRARALNDLAERLFDLLPVTRAAYYHRDMRGSWSIKDVLPTIAADLDYARLEVQEAGAAQLAFLELRRPGLKADRRETLTRALLDYCSRDSWGLVVLRRFLCGEALGL